MPFQPTREGYDVNSHRRIIDHAPRGANGFLRSLLGEDNGEEYALWVNEVTMSYGLSGSTSQSYATRSYFPHNINAVSLNINCQFANQQSYADVTEFIRRMQVRFTSSLLLQIVAKGKDRNQSMKGSHESIAAEGYVGSVARAHNRHEYAPSLSFEFIVERFLSPSIWRDVSAKIQVLKTWKEVIEDSKPSGFIDNPDNALTLPKRDTSIEDNSDAENLITNLLNSLAGG